MTNGRAKLRRDLPSTAGTIENIEVNEDIASNHEITNPQIMETGGVFFQMISNEQQSTNYNDNEPNSISNFHETPFLFKCTYRFCRANTIPK